MSFYLWFLCFLWEIYAELFSQLKIIVFLCTLLDGINQK